MEDEKGEVVLGLGDASSPEPFTANVSSRLPKTPLYTDHSSSTLEEDEDLTYGSISSYTVGAADASVNEELVTGQWTVYFTAMLDDFASLQHWHRFAVKKLSLKAIAQLGQYKWNLVKQRVWK